MGHLLDTGGVHGSNGECAKYSMQVLELLEGVQDQDLPWAQVKRDRWARTGRRGANDHPFGSPLISEPRN